LSPKGGNVEGSVHAGFEITRAAPERFSALSAVLGRGFISEPMLQWSLGMHGDVAQRFTEYFGYFNDTLSALGMLWEAVQARGAAVWIPADADTAFMEALDASRTSIHTLTSDGGRRYDDYWGWVGARIPDERLWHLDSVAVEADSRGMGVGAALIRFGLDLARTENIGACLETATPKNVPYYEHLGFRVIDHADAPHGGPHTWFLRWDPSSDV
jgi:GNAT superfamily N-acetyltransferase